MRMTGAILGVALLGACAPGPPEEPPAPTPLAFAGPANVTVDPTVTPVPSQPRPPQTIVPPTTTSSDLTVTPVPGAVTGPAQIPPRTSIWPTPPRVLQTTRPDVAPRNVTGQPPAVWRY